MLRTGNGISVWPHNDFVKASSVAKIEGIIRSLEDGSITEEPETGHGLLEGPLDIGPKITHWTILDPTLPVTGESGAHTGTKGPKVQR